jgi:hypothetical protein
MVSVYLVERQNCSGNSRRIKPLVPHLLPLAALALFVYADMMILASESRL